MSPQSYALLGVCMVIQLNATYLQEIGNNNALAENQEVGLAGPEDVSKVGPTSPKQPRAEGKGCSQQDAETEGISVLQQRMFRGTGDHWTEEAEGELESDDGKVVVEESEDKQSQSAKTHEALSKNKAAADRKPTPPAMMPRQLVPAMAEEVSEKTAATADLHPAPDRPERVSEKAEAAADHPMPAMPEELSAKASAGQRPNAGDHHPGPEELVQASAVQRPSAGDHDSMLKELTIMRHKEKRQPEEEEEEARQDLVHHKRWTMLFSALFDAFFNWEIIKARSKVPFETFSEQLACALSMFGVCVFVALYKMESDNSMNSMNKTELAPQGGTSVITGGLQSGFASWRLVRLRVWHMWGRVSVRREEPSMPLPQTTGQVPSSLGCNAFAQAIRPAPVPMCEEVSNEMWAMALQVDGSRLRASSTTFLPDKQNWLHQLWMRWFGGGFCGTPSRPVRQGLLASSLTAGGMSSIHGWQSKQKTNMGPSSTALAQQDQALALALLLRSGLVSLPGDKTVDASFSQSAPVSRVSRVLCSVWVVQSFEQSLVIPRLEPTSTTGHAIVSDAAGYPTLKACFKLSVLSNGRMKLPTTLATPQDDECLVLYSTNTKTDTLLASCRSSFINVCNSALTIHDASGELFGVICMGTGKLAGGFEVVAYAGLKVFCNEEESGSLRMTDQKGRALAATKDCATFPACRLLQVKRGVDAGLLVLGILACDLFKAAALPGEHAHENFQ